MKNIEIEIQVQVTKIKPLLDFLKKNGKFVGEKQQIDEYFVPTHRNFIKTRPVNEWLRLRDANNKYSINYKNWHRDKDGRGHHCDEFETTVEDIEQIKNIFKVLNFKTIVKVDKTRQTWTYKNYEIAVDKVKKLGNFVEIEYIGRKKIDPKIATAQMVQFLKDRGCGKILRNYVGYPFQLLFPKETKFEEQ